MMHYKLLFIIIINFTGCWRLGTGGLHRKAKPVRCVTQSQREPIRIKQGRTLLNFKSKKKPTPSRTEPAGHPDSGQAPHSVGQPGGDSYGVNSSLSYYYQFYRLGTGGLHKKAKPVGCVTQSQREPIRIKQGRNYSDTVLCVHVATYLLV